MNDTKLKAVYDAVMYQTSERRDQMIDFWTGEGEDMSPSADEELDKEMLNLQKLAEKSAALSMVALNSADDKIKEIIFAQYSQDNNYDVSPGDPIEFEDE